MRLEALASRITRSTVVWSWGFNFLRLASGVLLLPLLLRLWTKEDLGMYYQFLSLNAIVVVLDLGFSPTLGRFINYAMGGAKKLSAIGVAADTPQSAPNQALLWELLETGRVFYRLMMLATVLILGVGGSLLIGRTAAETSSVQLTWLAWGVCILAVAAETYFNLWNVFLRNMNQVLAATRISVFAYGLRLALACALVLAGWGLLSVPAASLVTSFIIRNFSRRACLRALDPRARPATVDWRGHLRVIWPNAWRLGIYYGGAYLSTNANILLCSAVFGLAANQEYGLSLQVLNIVGGMASVWTSVKWPLVGQLIARRDIPALRRVAWSRIWLQVLSYACLAAAALSVGPWVVDVLGKDKAMLPLIWLLLMTVNGFLETHCVAWNTLISLWNELPMVWPSLVTNAVSLTLNLALVFATDVGPGVLVLGPLLAGAAFNYWYWPKYGAGTLRLTWLQFLSYGLRRSPDGRAAAL